MKTIFEIVSWYYYIIIIIILIIIIVIIFKGSGTCQVAAAMEFLLKEPATITKATG
jgi:uncharacterized membrane protein YqiK